MMEMMQIQQNMNTTRNIPQERRCYTVEELMEILGVGRKAVYSLIHRKVFPGDQDQQRGLQDSEGELPCLAVSAALSAFLLTQAGDRLKTLAEVVLRSRLAERKEGAAVSDKEATTMTVRAMGAFYSG